MDRLRDTTKEASAEAVRLLENTLGIKYSDEQMNILMHNGGMCILACAGAGKALKNGTKVLTPKGYIAIEKLKASDSVYSQDGKAYSVLGVYPQGKKQVYKLHLSDGTVIDCCKDHIWVCKTPRSDWCDKTTSEIGDMLECGSDNEISIPMTQPVKFTGNNLKIKPYTLGVLLSSTSHFDINSQSYTLNLSSNKGIISRVNDELLEFGITLTHISGTNYKIDSSFPDYNDHSIDKLINIDRIPMQYKLSSIEDRLSLLQGIIDISGNYIDGNYELMVHSKGLADDIKFVCETLGFTATQQSIGVMNDVANHYDDGEAYKIRITISEQLPKLHWALDIKTEEFSRDNKSLANRVIINIEETDEYADMTCIMVDSPNHTFLTENCVVTHNTTVLTNLIAKRIITHEIADVDKLLCTTYSKSGAIEMETRLNKLLNNLGIRKSVQVKTMHALYLGVLKDFGYPSTVISNSDRRKYILEACKDAEVYLDEEEFQTLDSLLSYQVNNLLSDTDLVHSYTFTLETVDIDKYSAIRKGYNSRKVKARVIDFDDMQLYMYSLIYNQSRQDIVNYCRLKWKDIYVDEAQDMSRIQYAILKKIIVDPSRFVLVGDDDQCIYQWRGADPNIILNVCADYDIERFILSTNYRCAGNIVEKAAAGIVHNSKRSNKSMSPFKQGGEIKICDCGNTNLYVMSKYAYKYIYGLIKSGVNPKDIAILSRNNAHLSILNNMLFKDGIYCETSPDMRFTKNPVYKTIKDIIELSCDTYNHNLTANTLYKLCMYLKKVDAKRIANIQRDSGLSLSDTLGYLLKRVLNRRDVSWNKLVKIPTLAATKIEQSLAYLRSETVESLVHVYELLTDEDDKSQRLKSLLAMFLMATDYMYGGNPDRRRSVDGLVEYVSDLAKNMGVEVIQQFFKMTEQYEDGGMAIPGTKVCMSTMHGAKGKEWDHVVLFADDNVTFPSFNGIRGQLMSGVSTSEVCYGIDENRRLHYVAMTRAKKSLGIFTDRSNVGVFLLESLGIFNCSQQSGNTAVSSNDAHIISMANNGELYKELKSGIDNVIFNNSEFLLDIDISDISASIGVDYSYRGKEKSTVSLDTIITASPETIDQ